MLRRILLAAVALTVFTAAPVLAHADLTSSNPRDGQTLDAPPKTVTFRFSEDLLTGGNRVVAQDGSGTPLTLGATQVKGSVLSASWPSNAAAGEYTVAYRAVAADGHPMQGKVTFTIAASTVTQAPAAQETPSPAAAPVAEQSTSNPWLIAGPVLLVAVLVAAGFFVWRSRE